MADEDTPRRPLFGNRSNGDSQADAPKVTDADANATKTTTPSESADTGKPDASVTDAEAEALQGAGGPNRTPAFVKRDFEDENVQLTDTDDLASAKAGAAAASATIGEDGAEDFAGIMAARAAGEPREGQEDEAVYTSTPISALRLGKFQFENGVLRLNAEDAEVFEKLLGQAAIRTRQVIRKIDRSAGEAVARRYLDQHKGRRTSGVDTSDKGPQAARPQVNA